MLILTKLNRLAARNREDLLSHPKNEVTNAPLVLSSSGTESFPFVSAISTEAFFALKKAWKNTNLEKKQHKTN